jgi:hypothetical protein
VGHQHLINFACLSLVLQPQFVNHNSSSILGQVRYNEARSKLWAPESGALPMTTETITIRVDVRAAQAFNTASDEERRKLEALVSLRLLEATQTTEPLEQLMRRISHNAQQRGLTPDILQDILNESE